MGNQHSNGNGNKKKTTYKVPPGAEKPYAPAKPTVEYIGEDVMVRWSEPVFNGGCPIIGYILQFNRVDGEIWESYRVNGTECLLQNLDDTFVFRVVAENLVGYSEPSETSLPVSFEFSEPTLLVPLNHEVRAIEFEKVELNCRIWGMPSPELIWYLNGEELLASNRIYKHTDGIDYKLVFNHIKISDEGEIRAVAKNLLGEIETAASIIVEAPPRIKSPKHYDEGIIARAGENLRLKFGFTGRPKAEVTWYHEAEPIVGKKSQTQEIGDVAILTLENVKRTDGGEYTIRVENSIGEDVAHVLVTVTDRPSAPSKPIVIQLSDNSCLLEWEQLSEDVIAYIVEYFRDGWGVWLKALSTRSKGCKIRDLIPGSKYRFRIKAENHFGTSENGEESVQIYIPESNKEQGSVMSSIQEDEFEVFSEFNPDSSFEKLEQIVPPIPETRKPKTEKSPQKTKAAIIDNPLKSYLSKADSAYLPKTENTSKTDFKFNSDYSSTTDQESKADYASKPDSSPKIEYSPKTDYKSKIDYSPKTDYKSKIDYSPKIEHKSKMDYSTKTDYSSKSDYKSKADPIAFDHFSSAENLKTKSPISFQKTDALKVSDGSLQRKELRTENVSSDFFRRTGSASPIDEKPLVREGNLYRRDQLIGNSGKMKSDDSLSSVTSSQSDNKNRYFEQYSVQPRAARGTDRFEKYRRDQKQDTAAPKHLPADVTKDSTEDLNDSFKDTSFVIVEDVDDDYEDESMDFVVSQLIVPVKKGNVKISTSFDNGSVCASSVKSSMDDLSLDPSRNNTPDLYQNPNQNLSLDNLNAVTNRSHSASSSVNGSRTNLLQSFAEFSKGKFQNSENIEENPFFVKRRPSPTPLTNKAQSSSPSSSPSVAKSNGKESENKEGPEEEDHVRKSGNEAEEVEQLVEDKAKTNNKSLKCRINDVVDVTVALLLLCMLGPLLFMNVYTFTVFCLLLIKMTFM